jgi:hypothetical protein
VLGGVPTGKIRYDNLKSAVAQVLGFSRARVENDRWTAFRSHYDLDAFYCQPGLAGAHEKGGVEAQIGWFRRNHLVPVPDVASVDELNAMIDAWDAADEARRSAAVPARSESSSPSRNRCSSHCQRSRSRPAGGSPHGWTGPRPGRCRVPTMGLESSRPRYRQAVLWLRSSGLLEGGSVRRR